MWQSNVTFANSHYLYLLALIPLLVFWYIRRRRALTSDLRFSTLLPFQTIKPTAKERLLHTPFVLRMIALSLLIVALARPQTASHGESRYTEGIDIVIVLDISSSMLAKDFKPNRIEAAKEVAEDFIDGRTHDRIGLVVFAGQGFTQCPMTLDYRVLKNLLQQVKSGVGEDGTAIGMAIAQGVNRLKESVAKSKVMILLTDGVNNRGEIDPLTATQIAQTYGVRIYTIGVGTEGSAPYPVQTPFGTEYRNLPVEIDEKMLKEIATETHGEYFRATENKSLKKIYSEIDKLTKTRIEVKAYRSYTELFYPWVGLGLVALVLEFSISRIWLRKIP
ncbi:MAG: VWA domain-containing protein [Nitrospirae bacterium]|nr:VWA domain-containing protein [Candidatus Troglogloeales bacterium]